ncbi:hypothetical protein [Chromobacterium alticapitis]|uniref:hypothetical protein n=1 Tax=Chromobacterium alticapitis TaxID=2073169 RepID=UPI0011B0E1A3|nr:hypothetical protein [Chromobacterium alticapitis]
MTPSMTNEFQQKTNEAFSIIEKIMEKNPPQPPMNKHEEFLEGLRKKILSHAISGFIVMLIFAGAAYLFPISELLNTTFTLSLLVQLTGLVLQLIVIGSIIPFAWEMIKKPHAQFLRLVKRTYNFDIEHVELLSKCDPATLSHLLIHYKNQRTALEKRSSLISGSVEKIGFMPAISSLVVLYLSLTKFPIIQNWINSLVFLLLAFYCLNISIFAMLQKQDRVISLLEYSISSRS